MTREEAIAYGRRVIELGLNDETHAFCKIALEALEQEPTTKNDLGVDCISRQALYDALYERFHEEDINNITNVTLGSVRNFVKDFPSVTPKIEPKTGHWIDVKGSSNIKCSVCHAEFCSHANELDLFDYCPKCGADMRESEGNK